MGGYNALLWLGSSCRWNTTQSNKAVTVLLTSFLINSLKALCDRLSGQCCINNWVVLFIVWWFKASLYIIFPILWYTAWWAKSVMILSVTDSAFILLLGGWIVIFLWFQLCGNKLAPQRLRSQFSEVTQRVVHSIFTVMMRCLHFNTYITYSPYSPIVDNSEYFK